MAQGRNGAIILDVFPTVRLTAPRATRRVLTRIRCASRKASLQGRQRLRRCRWPSGGQGGTGTGTGTRTGTGVEPIDRMYVVAQRQEEKARSREAERRSTAAKQSKNKMKHKDRSANSLTHRLFLKLLRPGRPLLDPCA